MRIECPYCGDRDVTEFTYLGDAGSARPDGSSEGAGQRMFEAVYLRENPAGQHIELWYHGFGCRSWLQVIRDTRTHKIYGSELCREVGP